MLTTYNVYDSVPVEELEKADYFSYDGQVYEVASHINDRISEIEIPVYDEMDDADILFLPAGTIVNLLREDY